MATVNPSRSASDLGASLTPVRALTPPPPLENGDRLTRAEFERRYAAMPHIKKAELIEGVVHMASPVRMASHSEPTRIISTWLGTYQFATPGLRGGDNPTVRLDDDNEPQPDHILMIPRDHGGQGVISEGDYIESSPELVVEVAASTVSYDLHEKLQAYRRNRVREYVVWRTLDRAVDWLAWREGEYVPLAPDAEGILKSEVFPGLWLDVPALLRDDPQAVLAALQRGLATAEHREFAARLRG